MTWTSRAQFQTLTIVTSASITTSYVAVVTLNSPTVLAAVKNGTNGDVLIGTDGSTAIWGFPANSGAVYDVRTNSPQIANLMLPTGTVLYLKWNGSAPGTPSGNLYIELMQVVNE
jgi:hypothetical protein